MPIRGLFAPSNGPGLYGDGGGLFGVSPQPNAQGVNPGNDARLAFASQLLQGSGGNSGNFAEIMGKALLASRQARLQTQEFQNQQKAQEAEVQFRQQQLAQRQAEFNKPPEDPAEIRTLRVLQGDPELMKLYQQMNAGKESTPASVQEWQFFQTLAPDAQKQYLNMKRQPAAPQLAEIGGVQNIVDRVSGAVTPLSTLDREAAAQAVLAQGKAGGAARGEASGKAVGAIEARGTGAKAVLQLLDMADPLIDASTGSIGGKAVDAVAGSVGKSTEGANAIAQLKVLQPGLMLGMPRMEGPQSDRDVQLYREAAGRIADATVPRAQRKAAVKTIRDLQLKYQENAATQPAGASSTNLKSLLDKYAPGGQ